MMFPLRQRCNSAALSDCWPTLPQGDNQFLAQSLRDRNAGQRRNTHG